ncbi:hypothetical protein RHMOL_Rhmol05G0320100 [Rhododendron molle]|uniref:Uncharacterized protein n=1 Tax=Rhododendron molle TaxID=49168 RepID=A0ACC0NWF6_RHOML|nr:hypothetical protein RHMOL_Rhmol05G0320100 [Rhododendron molle]
MEPPGLLFYPTLGSGFFASFFHRSTPPRLLSPPSTPSVLSLIPFYSFQLGVVFWGWQPCPTLARPPPCPPPTIISTASLSMALPNHLPLSLPLPPLPLRPATTSHFPLLVRVPVWAVDEMTLGDLGPPTQ